MRFSCIAVLLFALLPVRVMAADFSTPQGALLALEDAYRAHDIEAAVAAKNFTYEARAMLSNLKSTPHPEASLVQEATHVLELSYRKEMNGGGFPDMKGVQVKVVGIRQLDPDFVELAEQITYADGYVSRETVYAALSGKRWGIVNLPDK